jgi:hypothetical protein
VGDMASQGRAIKQESLDEADFVKPSSLLSRGRSRARQGGARPKALQGHKYNPLGAQGGVIDPSIHQRVAKTKEKHREADDGRRESSKLSRRWPRPTLAALHG